MSTAATADRTRLRNRLLAAAVGASPVAVFTVDGNGVIAFAEGGAVASLSSGKSEIEGLAVGEAWGRSLPLVEAVEQALAGIRFAGDLRIAGRIFAVRLIPMHDREGVVTGVAGLAAASDRQAPEPAAGDPVETVADLADSLPFAVWVLDHRGDVVRDNDLAREQGIGAVRCAREIAPPGGSLVGRVLLDGVRTEGTVLLHDSSGARVNVKMRGVPLRNEKGSTVGAVLVAAPPDPPLAPPSFVDPLRSRATLPPFPWALPALEAAEAGAFA